VSELSNLLRQRLASGPGVKVRSDGHPDADTLTAYVERLLPAAERNRVFEHLAACSHCREVTAMALPGPAEEQQVVATVPAGRRWGFLWNPWFRLAAALPIVVIVATVLFQRNQTVENFKRDSAVPPATYNEKAGAKDSSAPEAARGESDTQPSANGIAGKTPSGVNDALGNARGAASLAAAPAAPARNSATTTTNEPVMMARAGIPARRDYVNSDFFANNTAQDGVPGTVTAAVNVGELPPAPSPRVSNQFPSPTLSINAANTMPFIDMPTQSTGTQTVRTIAPPSGGSHWGIGTLTALGPKAKKALAKSVSPSIPVGGLSFSAMELNPRTQPSEAAAAARPPDSGVSGLEDAGAFRSRARSDSSVTAKAEMREAISGSWRISSGRLVRPGEAGNWVEACPGSAAIEFTTFTTHGSELWAGGSNAALIHSRDGGATCKRIVLGASATGAIIRIEVRNASVQVKSSSGQSWSSQDGGETWKMDE